MECSLNFDRFLLSTYLGSGSSVVLDQLINSCEVNLLNNEGRIQQRWVGVTSVFIKHPRLRLNFLNTQLIPQRLDPLHLFINLAVEAPKLLF